MPSFFVVNRVSFEKGDTVSRILQFDNSQGILLRLQKDTGGGGGGERTVVHISTEAWVMGQNVVTENGFKRKC